MSSNSQSSSVNASGASSQSQAAQTGLRRVIGCDCELKNEAKFFKLYFKFTEKPGDQLSFGLVDAMDGSGKWTKFSVLRKNSSDIDIAQYSPRVIINADVAKFEIMKDVKQTKRNSFKVKLRKVDTRLDLQKYFTKSPPQTSSSSSDENHNSDDNH